MSLSTSFPHSLDLVVMSIIADVQRTDSEKMAVDSVPDLEWKGKERRGFRIASHAAPGQRLHLGIGRWEV